MSACNLQSIGFQIGDGEKNRIQVRLICKNWIFHQNNILRLVFHHVVYKVHKILLNLQERLKM
jgi:hypothetical protein